MLALLNISCHVIVLGWSDRGSSLWPVVMAVNTLSVLLSRLNFVSQVLYSVLKACKWGEKDWIWVTLMLSSVTPLHFPGPETQGTLSSINEENVPVGLVFVKPNYIHSVGKVRINLSNPFWMCRMHHTIPLWKYPPWCWRELAEQKYCAVMVDVLPVNNWLCWPLYSTSYSVGSKHTRAQPFKSGTVWLFSQPFWASRVNKWIWKQMEAKTDNNTTFKRM